MDDSNRPDEGRAITAMIDGVTEHGSVMVVRGEAGIGKTTLLGSGIDHARDCGMLCLAVTGVQSESHLAFAALHLLMQPLMRRVRDLPSKQRAALESAFGMSEVAAPDPFLIALATLDLLADAASQSPLLLTVDDAQWLDRATANVLSFVARRLSKDPIVMLIACRDHADDVFDRSGLGDLRLGPLNDFVAAALLDAHAPDLSPAMRQRVLDEAAGNPLALIELPRGVGAADELPTLSEHIALGDRLERAFVAQVQALPSATQDALLVAAADASCDTSQILAAASILNVGPIDIDVLTPAVADRLVDLDARNVTFRHPLVRSAVYQAVPLAIRVKAHAALAQVLADQPERSVWHRAAAVLGSDEAIAADLERVAARARRRGGGLVAVAGLERSAELSVNPVARARRLLRAAELAYELGRTDLARPLVTRVDNNDLDEAERGRMTLIQELVAPGSFASTNWRWLIEVGEGAHRDGDGDLALEILWLVAIRSFWADPGPAVRREIVAALDRIGARDDPRVLCALGYAAGEERGRQIVEGLDRVRAVAGLDADEARLLGMAALIAGAWDQASAFLFASASGLRAEGRLGHMPRVLVLGALLAVRAGNWPVAFTANDEARALAVETGQDEWIAGADSVAALAAAMSGDEASAELLAAKSERRLASSAISFILANVQTARGAAALGSGRYQDAFDDLLRIFTSGDPAYQRTMRWWVLADLVEAAIRSGNRSLVEPIVADAERVVGSTPAFWHQVMIRHARALLADPDNAEECFRDALSLDLRHWPFERARLLLAHGEWLRRHRRIADARAPLRAARETFDAVTARAWAERARNELRASGETSRPRVAAAFEQLSPQELQIVQLAAAGFTNREIGQQLYVSPRTVSSHLYHAFPKLGVTSRAKLKAAIEGAGLVAVAP
ncbi:MAG: hypothetical protein QOE09_432 [Ilumatobacteraceae bacterium]